MRQSTVMYRIPGKLCLLEHGVEHANLGRREVAGRLVVALQHQYVAPKIHTRFGDTSLPLSRSIKKSRHDSTTKQFMLPQATLVHCVLLLCRCRHSSPPVRQPYPSPCFQHSSNAAFHRSGSQPGAGAPRLK
jgi:hypothetical protein